MNSSRLFQCVLEYLTTHTGINHRVPVHQFYSSRSKSLRKLIHRCASLLRGRTGHGSQVSNTLNGIHRSFKVNASRRESTDITSHFSKVINRKVGIFIQLIQCVVDVLQSRTFTFCIRKNCLNSIKLGFIFIKTGFNWIDSQSRYDPFTSINCGVSDVGEGGYSHDFQSRKFCPHGIYRVTKSGHINILGSGANIF